MISTDSAEFAEMYPVAAAKIRRAKMDAVLPNFRSWARTADGGAELNGYRVVKISDRAFVAYAPSGDAVPNSGDWTSADRPFQNIPGAVAACRAYAVR